MDKEKNSISQFRINEKIRTYCIQLTADITALCPLQSSQMQLIKNFRDFVLHAHSNFTMSQPSFPLMFWKDTSETRTKILDLCRQVVPFLCKDLGRLVLMEGQDAEYAKTETKKLARDLILLDLVGAQLDSNDPYWPSIWFQWLRVRNILAKYLNEDHPMIRSLDWEYRLTHFRWLPQFSYFPRPSKELLRKTWDQQSEDERRRKLNNLARGLFNKPEAPEWTFEELETPLPVLPV